MIELTHLSDAGHATRLTAEVACAPAASGCALQPDTATELNRQ